jgi:hypothetical protein
MVVLINLCVLGPSIGQEQKTIRFLLKDWVGFSGSSATFHLPGLAQRVRRPNGVGNHIGSHLERLVVDGLA